MINIYKNYIRKSYDSNTHNFTKLKNFPQSKAILTSLIERSSDNEIKKLAKVKLQALK